MTDQLLVLAWRDPGVEPSDFADALFSFVRSGTATRTGTAVAQVNLADRHVEAAASLRQRALDPAPDALLRITGAGAADRPAAAFSDVEAALDSVRGIDRITGYAVTTREPLADSSHTVEPGERRPGWSQVALLRRAPGMDTDAFRARWLEHHTRVALDIQSTFRYVQHLVETPLGDTAPQLDGIVEECFPTEAMDDPHVFFATGGDNAVLDERVTQMVHSVSAFLDLGNLDVIPTSEYRFDH